MTIIRVDPATDQPTNIPREAHLKGLPSRPTRGDWSVAERDWLESQYQIANAMRRELTISPGAYHTLCALQWPSARIVDDVAARLPQFQRIVSVVNRDDSTGHIRRPQDVRCETLVTHPVAWCLKEPRQGRMFFLLDPDAVLSSLLSPRYLLRNKAEQEPCAYALVSPGQKPSGFATALRDEGHDLCWQESVQGNARHWHLSLWRSRSIGPAGSSQQDRNHD